LKQVYTTSHGQKKRQIRSFQVLTAVLTKILVFWGWIPYQLMNSYRR